MTRDGPSVTAAQNFEQKRISTCWNLRQLLQMNVLAPMLRLGDTVLKPMRRARDVLHTLGVPSPDWASAAQ